MQVEINVKSISLARLSSAPLNCKWSKQFMIQENNLERKLLLPTRISYYEETVYSEM